MEESANDSLRLELEPRGLKGGKKGKSLMFISDEPGIDPIEKVRSGGTDFATGREKETERAT